MRISNNYVKHYPRIGPCNYSGLWGPAAPLGPVVAPLVPRCALLPAPTPRLNEARGPTDPTFCVSERSCFPHNEAMRRISSLRMALTQLRGRLSGGWGREGVRS